MLTYIINTMFILNSIYLKSYFYNVEFMFKTMFKTIFEQVFKTCFNNV